MHALTFFAEAPLSATAPLIRGGRNGTDIFIEDPASPEIPTSLFRTIWAPASCTVLQSESQSFKFFSGFQSASVHGASAVTLINSRHSVVARSLKHLIIDPVPNFRPSVYWAGSGRQGSRLLLIGGRFRGDYERLRRDLGDEAGGALPAGPTGPRHVASVVLSNGFTGAVYELGVTTSQGGRQDGPIPMRYTEVALGHQTSSSYTPVLYALPASDINGGV